VIFEMQSKISKPRPLKHSSIGYAGFAANSTADKLLPILFLAKELKHCLAHPQFFLPWDLKLHLRPDQASCTLSFLQIEKWEVGE